MKIERMGEAEWQVAHRELSRLARVRAVMELEEGRWLLAAARSGTHTRLGFGSFVEYVERLFGYAPRLTQEKLRVAEALAQLPMASQALQEGQLCLLPRPDKRISITVEVGPLDVQLFRRDLLADWMGAAV